MPLQRDRGSGEPPLKRFCQDHCFDNTSWHSQTQTELNEKLEECLHKLNQARLERQESEKETRLKETVAGFQRSMPGKLVPCADIVRQSHDV